MVIGISPEDGTIILKPSECEPVSFYNKCYVWHTCHPKLCGGRPVTRNFVTEKQGRREQRMLQGRE